MCLRLCDLRQQQQQTIESKIMGEYLNWVVIFIVSGTWSYLMILLSVRKKKNLKFNLEFFEGHGIFIITMPFSDTSN